MSITTNVTMPPQRPSNMVEWIGLITSAIKELRGEDWFLDNNFTFKEVLTAINNDKDFYTTIVNKINLKLDKTSYNAADILAKLKTVDGLNSGLDADTVRGYNPVNKAGDVMSGYLTLNADPMNALHAVTKQYVDEMIQGFSIKKSVRALAAVNITLSGLQTIDGVVLKAGDRVLVINQALRSENGIYEVKTTSWSRTTDADQPENFTNGSAVFVLEGNEYADSGWVMTTDGEIVVGTTAIEFDKFSGAGQIIPVDGLYKQGNKMGLTDTGVSAGTYTKVTVDVKGRVVSATILSPSDIPSLDWSKITSGKPTTLSGYGITDGVNVSEVVTAATPNKILKLNSSSKLPASITGNADGNAATATKLQTARTISISGAGTGSISFDGTSNVTIPLTLENSGVAAGTYTKVTVDAKGLVTSATTLIPADIPSLDWSKITSGKPTTLSGYGITDGVNIAEVVTTATANKILKLDDNKKLPASITGNADGNAATATKWQTARTLSLGGVLTGSVSVDGTSNMTLTAQLTDTGVSSGTYTKVTVDAKGRVTTATTLSPSDIPSLDWSKITSGKPTTLDEYGIVDGTERFKLPALSSANASYVKIAEMNTSIGTGENALMLYINGVVEFGVNTPGADILQVSTRSSVNLNVYSFIPLKNSYAEALYGYVNNVGTGKTEIWMKRAGFSYGTNVIVALSRNATYGALTTQSTEPEGIVYVTKETYALTSNNVATASKLQTARTITLNGDVTGSFSFDGSGNVSFNTTYKNSGVAAGTYTKVTVDTKGNVTSATTLSASDIPNLDWSKITSGKPTTLSGYGIVDGANKVHDHAEFVKLDGSRNMTGPLTLSGDPVQPLHATTKQYVDGLVQGIRARTSVTVATTANITLSASQSIDGITVTSGMRVLVKNQTNATQNGIYVAKDGAWSRAPEYDENSEFDGSVFVFVERGTTLGDTGWVLETDGAVNIGTTALNFTQFSRAGVTEGDGTTIVRNGNIISQKSGVVSTGTYTKVTVDTYGRVTSGSTLSPSDIPSLDWSKITSGKPNTLSGYGITDATPSSHTSVVASTTTLGHVKTGNGIGVTSDGTISADVDGTTIILSGTSPNQKIMHADTSTQSSVTNANNTVIQSIALDGMGHVTSISSKTLTASDVSAVPVTDVVTTSTANKILKLDASGKLPANITGNADGNAATATKLQTARSIALAGDVTGSVSFDGSGNVTINTSYKNSGVTAGTYTVTTVDAKGNVTNGSRPTNVEDLGITNVKTIDGKGSFKTITSSGTMNQWTKVATSTISTQSGATNVSLLFIQNDGADGTARKAQIEFRVKQQASLGGAPYVNLAITERMNVNPNDFVAIVTENTTSRTIVDLYVRINTTYAHYVFTPLLQSSYNGSLTFHNDQSYISSLPTGTQIQAGDKTLTSHEAIVATSTQLGHVKTGDGLLTDSSGSAYIDAGDGVILTGTSPNKKVQADVDGTTIILSGSSPNKKIAHADTSNQASVSNSGATVIQSVSVDGMGHVTGLTSKTITTSDISAVPTSDVVTSPAANKILKLNSSSKLPASITGDADTVDGLHGSQLIRNDVVNTGEVKFNKGTYADPHSGTGYAVKASGGISTDKINIGGKIDLVYNESEESLDIVFI